MDKQKIPPSPGSGVKDFLNLFFLGWFFIGGIYCFENQNHWAALLILLSYIFYQLQGFLKNNKMKNIMTIVIIIIIMIVCGLMMWESRNGFS
ncbi:hypothetical protein N9S70_02205 [Flavobacteriaceae bacterium]|nr:hypothetical protein [Flavobacteriaceae bacterium]